MKEGPDIALTGSLVGGPALRKARVCYNHLAGEMGVRLFDSMRARAHLSAAGDNIVLTGAGQEVIRDLGSDLDALGKGRRPLCRSCLDWSARRTHLGGSLGTAMLDRFYAEGWAKRTAGWRVVEFSGTGEKHFLNLFPLE